MTGAAMRSDRCATAGGSAYSSSRRCERWSRVLFSHPLHWGLTKHCTNICICPLSSSLKSYFSPCQTTTLSGEQQAVLGRGSSSRQRRQRDAVCHSASGRQRGGRHDLHCYRLLVCGFRTAGVSLGGVRGGDLQHRPPRQFQNTILTKLGPKRLVRVVGIDENATDSEKLAAHFTIEDDVAAAATATKEDTSAEDQPRSTRDKTDYTLADHVIARSILAFRNGWDSCIAPTIDSIVVRRDHHGHDLARGLFGAVEEWFFREWTPGIKEGGRMLQATQLGNFIVDGLPIKHGGGSGEGGGGGSCGGGGGGGDVGEAGPCGGLTFVTDKQLLHNTLGFLVSSPADGSIIEALSAHHRTEDEG